MKIAFEDEVRALLLLGSLEDLPNEASEEIWT
jgi:hypothetical protein